MTLQQDETGVGPSMDDAQAATQKQPPKRSWLRRIAIGASLALGLLVVTVVGLAIAQYVIQSRAATQGGDVKGLEVAIATNQKSKEIEVPEEPRHPIEPALDRAKDCLQHSHRHISDYTAIATMRQRQEDGTLASEVTFLKVRNRKLDEDGNLAVPLAVYMKYLEPKLKAGREVIWTEGANDEKLIGHEPGLLPNQWSCTGALSMATWLLPCRKPVAM